MSGSAHGRACVGDRRSIAEPILTDAVFGFEVDQNRGPGPKVVEAHDLVAQERIDDLSDFAELLLRQCFVGEATPAVKQDPSA